MSAATVTPSPHSHMHRALRTPQWLREPLLRFAVLGAVLFAADYALVGRAEDRHAIVVDNAVDSNRGACLPKLGGGNRTTRSCMRCGASGSTTRCCIARASHYGSTTAMPPFARA